MLLIIFRNPLILGYGCIHEVLKFSPYPKNSHPQDYTYRIAFYYASIVSKA